MLEGHSGSVVFLFIIGGLLLPITAWVILDLIGADYSVIALILGLALSVTCFVLLNKAINSGWSLDSTEALHVASVMSLGVQGMLFGALFLAALVEPVLWEEDEGPSGGLIESVADTFAGFISRPRRTLALMVTSSLFAYAYGRVAGKREAKIEAAKDAK